MITVFANAIIFDGMSDQIIDNGYVIVEGDRIREVADGAPSMTGARTVDVEGRFLMPGLIDAHFHAYTPTFNLELNDRMPPSLMASHAARILEGTLLRGFTTVRDAAGGDIGLRMAIDQGLIRGPRFFFSGKALSQTGGHGDMRPGDATQSCGCAGYSGAISLVVDGADAVRKAAREELRKGATQIKLFVSGGVVSPTDPMWMPQFTDDEIKAAVQEASTRRTYVMAHAHTDAASRRCAELGVRTIEHGTSISDETAVVLATAGCFVVPTLSVAQVLREHGARIGIPAMGLDKIRQVGDSALRSIETCRRAGVRLGLGADLLSHEFHPQQGGELALRAEIEQPIDVLRSATSINAEILQMSQELGCLRAGAYADLLVLNGNPLTNIELFREPNRNIALIMKGGQVIRSYLS